MLYKYSTRLNEDRIPFLVKESSYPVDRRHSLDAPSKTHEILRDVLRMQDMAEEHVFQVCLNAAMRPVGIFEIAKGGINSSIVDLRVPFRNCILLNATGYVLAHNHPSGDVTPSKWDVEVTKALTDAGKIMHIDLLDHIIVGENAYYSFLESGWR